MVGIYTNFSSASNQPLQNPLFHSPNFVERGFRPARRIPLCGTLAGGGVSYSAHLYHFLPCFRSTNVPLFLLPRKRTNPAFFNIFISLCIVEAVLPNCATNSARVILTSSPANIVNTSVSRSIFLSIIFPFLCFFTTISRTLTFTFFIISSFCAAFEVSFIFIVPLLEFIVSLREVILSMLAFIVPLLEFIVSMLGFIVSLLESIVSLIESIVSLLESIVSLWWFIMSFLGFIVSMRGFIVSLLGSNCPLRLFIVSLLPTLPPLRWLLLPPLRFLSPSYFSRPPFAFYLYCLELQLKSFARLANYFKFFPQFLNFFP